MSELNYVPSWLDSAMTLLEKLNKCIEKIETIVSTVVSVTKTADDALSLAKTNEANIAINESDITAIQGDITAIQGDINRLDNIIDSTRELTDQALSTANRAETKAAEAASKANQNQSDITALQNEKSGKLYLHEISITINKFTVKFKIINSESQPMSQYEGASKEITLKGFDFVGRGTVSNGKICTHMIGNPRYTITYGRTEGVVFSEIMGDNLAFIDPDGTIFHTQELYKSGAPSAFTDSVYKL